MQSKNVLNLIHLYSCPSRILIVFLILAHFQIDPGEAKDIWCCRGWSDDLSSTSTSKSTPAPQVDTKECGYVGVCRGETSCADAANKDCATNWECGENDGAGYPNKTDDDCTKPEPGKICYCDKPFCNCPKSLKGIKTPSPNKKLKCCRGSTAIAPEKLEKPECDKLWDVCIGDTEDNNVTSLNCGLSDLQRLRGNCYKFSYKKYGYGSNNCRCTTDYCNCPKGTGSTGTRGIWVNVFKTQLVFLVSNLWIFFC